MFAVYSRPRVEQLRGVLMTLSGAEVISELPSVSSCPLAHPFLILKWDPGSSTQPCSAAQSSGSQEVYVFLKCPYSLPDVTLAQIGTKPCIDREGGKSIISLVSALD